MYKDLFKNPVKHICARLELGGFFAKPTHSFSFKLLESFTLLYEIYTFPSSSFVFSGQRSHTQSQYNVLH